MNTRKRCVLLVPLISVLASCGLPMQYGATASPAMGGGNALTFAWHQESDIVVGDSRLAGNEFFEDCLHEAVAWELSMRGVRYDESSPTLMVHHHLSLADHEMETELVDESGSKVTEVYSYDEGSVAVHIHYPDGRTLWVGWAQADIGPAIEGPESMRKWVYAIVHSMFKNWPVPTRVEQ